MAKWRKHDHNQQKHLLDMGKIVNMPMEEGRSENKLRGRAGEYWAWFRGPGFGLKRNQSEGTQTFVFLVAEEAHEKLAVADAKLGNSIKVRSRGCWFFLYCIVSELIAVSHVLS